MQGPPAPRPSPSPPSAHRQLQMGRMDCVAAWGVGGGWNVCWGCIAAMLHGPRQADNDAMGVAAVCCCSSWAAAPPPRARHCPPHHRPPSAVVAPARPSHLTTASIQPHATSCRRHHHSNARWGTCAPSPEWTCQRYPRITRARLMMQRRGTAAGECDIAFVVHLPRQRTTRQRRRWRRRRQPPPPSSPPSGDNKRRTTTTTIANGDGTDDAVGGGATAGGVSSLFFVK